MLKLILCTCCLIIPFLTDAQVEKKPEQHDSLKLYKKIHLFASKRKLTKLLYEAVFVEPKSEEPVTKKLATKKQADPFKRFKGRVIRDIDFISLDPFGTDVNNPNLEIKGFFVKSGNRLHVKTTRFALRNQMLFKRGERLDPLKVKETERILRRTGYIRDAKIIIHPDKESRDTVDVTVVTQDIWSIVGSGAISTSSSRLKIIDKNFAGSGQTIDNQINYNYKLSPRFDITGSYTVPNIRNTFITGALTYRISSINYYQGITFDRQFYSPLTKWAGGVSFLWNHYLGSFSTPEIAPVTLPVRYNLQDVWFGRSFQVTPGKADVERSARLVTTGRIYKLSYTKRPGLELDTFRLYQNSTLYLGSIGYSTRMYYKDMNIFRFGYTEDVPEGRLLAFIGGVEKRELNSRWYSGIKLAGGNHINNFGYLAMGLEYGTFFRDKKAEKSVLTYDLTYFTDLQKYRRWSTRQFVYWKYTKGGRRDPNEFVTINNELYGYKGDPLLGTSKMLLNFQNVVYTPLHFVGFQFGLVGFVGLGMIGNNDRALLKSQVYQAYGLGVLIRNEHLVVNTFQISIGFYPNLSGTRGYKFNPIGNYDLRLKDYFLSKPDMIAFQ